MSDGYGILLRMSREKKCAGDQFLFTFQIFIQISFINRKCDREIQLFYIFLHNHYHVLTYKRARYQYKINMHVPICVLVTSDTHIAKVCVLYVPIIFPF
jgi:hypothetical protein